MFVFNLIFVVFHLQVPLPTMACRSSWTGFYDYDIGNVIGYIKKIDVTSGLTVELLHGDRCWTRRKVLTYNTTVDMICDMNAGVGQPMFNLTAYYYPRPVGCTYKIFWKSLYACPVCHKDFFRRVVTYCRNGLRNVRYVKITPCWGAVEGIPQTPDESLDHCNETTNSTDLPTVVVTRTVFINLTGDGHVAAHVVVKSTVNAILIGVGTVIVVVLIIVAGFFFFKHRSLKYRYFSMATRNKPMSRLEEEEEDLTNCDHTQNFRM